MFSLERGSYPQGMVEPRRWFREYQNAVTKSHSLSVAVMHWKKYHNKPLLFISKKRTSLPEVQKAKLMYEVFVANMIQFFF